MAPDERNYMNLVEQALHHGYSREDVRDVLLDLIGTYRHEIEVQRRWSTSFTRRKDWEDDYEWEGDDRYRFMQKLALAAFWLEDKGE